MNAKRIIISLVCFVVCLMLAWNAPARAGSYKVLILNGAADGANSEAPNLVSFEQVQGHTFTYEQVGINWQGTTHPVPDSVVLGEELEGGNIDLSQYDIIWLTWNGPGHDSDYFMEGAEDYILQFVEDGGLVWVSAFDDNYSDPDGRQIGGWMPIDEFPASISNTGDSAMELTPEGEASGLFTVPNEVDLDALTLDDNYAGLSDPYIILANRTDNNEPAAFRLPYGAGSYVGVCIDARSTFPAAIDLLENALLYFAGLSAGQAVEPESKLAATWGEIRSE